MKKRIEIFLYAVFLLGPMLLMPILPGSSFDAESSDAQLRRKVRELPLSLKRVTLWPRDVDKYLGVAFGGRRQLIVLDSIYKYWLGWSTHPDVSVGNSGWLFNKLDYLYPKHIGAYWLSNNSEDEWLKLLLMSADNIRSFNKEFYYAIAPNKHSVCCDKLSRGWKNKRTPFVKSLCMRMMKDRKYSFYIDLFGCLKSERQKNYYPVYQKYDSHWSPYGAYICYRNIISHISRDGTDLPVFEYSADIDALVEQPNDLARMIGLENVLSADEIRIEEPLNVPETPFLEWKSKINGVVCKRDGDKVKAVVYCDSFIYEYMRSWLTYSLGTTRYIHHCYFKYHNAYLKNSPASKVLLIQVERVVPMDFAPFAGVRRVPVKTQL